MSSQFFVSNVRCLGAGNSPANYCCNQHKMAITENFQVFFNIISQNSDFRAQMGQHQLDLNRDKIRWHISIVQDPLGGANHTYSIGATKVKPNGSDDTAVQFANISVPVAQECSQLFQKIHTVFAANCPHPVAQAPAPVNAPAAPAPVAAPLQPVQAAPQPVGGAPAAPVQPVPAAPQPVGGAPAAPWQPVQAAPQPLNAVPVAPAPAIPGQAPAAVATRVSPLRRGSDPRERSVTARANASVLETIRSESWDAPHRHHRRRPPNSNDPVRQRADGNRADRRKPRRGHRDIARAN